jgi:bacterioferritin
MRSRAAVHPRITTMLDSSATARVTTLPLSEHAPMVLNEAAIDAARASVHSGAASQNVDPWRRDIVRLLNGALAT